MKIIKAATHTVHKFLSFSLMQTYLINKMVTQNYCIIMIVGKKVKSME